MAKANDKIDEAVEAARETTVPLLIRRRCTPHQQAVWIAISFLLKTHPRADFGLREIAQEAGFRSSSKVGGWVNELVGMGLVAQERPEQKQADSRDNFPLIRAKYAIPWKVILEKSLQLAEDYVRHQVRGGNRLRESGAPGSDKQQLELNFHDPKGDHEGDPKGDHEGDPKGDHEGDPKGDHERSQRGSLSCTPLGSPWMDGVDGSSWMDGSTAPSKKRAGPGRPPTIPPQPPAELYAQHPQWAIGGPLPAHPRDLWANACGAATPAHLDLLAALAAEHDAATDGHGWYWLGRAILAGTTAQASIGHPNYLRNTLIRWRDEDSYGSDRARPAKEQPDGPPRPRAVGSRRGRAPAEAARPTPHLGGGSPPSDLTDDELAAIEDAAGAEFRRRAAERAQP